MNASGKREEKHYWCAGDRAPNGHWANTQGNYSDHSLSHPNALKPGFAASSSNKKYENSTKLPKSSSRKAAASSSSTGSTIAEADLLIAKENIEELRKQITDLVAVRDDLHLQLHKSMDLGNGKLSTAARTANEMVAAHAKQLRTANETTTNNGAIAKTKEMRAHAHQFAELMLGSPQDDEVINNAGWGERRPKKQSASSHSVYDIAKFDQVTSSATMNSPAPHVAYHLTAAKAEAPELVVDSFHAFCSVPNAPRNPTVCTRHKLGRAPWLLV